MNRVDGIPASPTFVYWCLRPDPSKCVAKRTSQAVLIFIVACAIASTCRAKEAIRAAIVGTDTSHCLAFTQLINAPAAKGALARVQVVAAYPGGSSDIAASRDRVQQFAEQLRELGVQIVDSPEAAATAADAILLESVDGRIHLDQFKKIASGKPVFIDKPAAASVAEFLEIMEVADRTNTPFFSSSALRFCPEVQRIAAASSVGNLLGASASTPYQTEPHHPDLFWYGIHGVEALVTILGPGCKEIQRQETDKGVLLTGKWRNGRQGAMWALATSNPVYSITVYWDKSVACEIGFSGYANLVEQICDFFITRRSPVSREETLEILAIMEAADESQKQGGAAVTLTTIIDHARQQIAERQAVTPAQSRGN